MTGEPRGQRGKRAGRILTDEEYAAKEQARVKEAADERVKAFASVRGMLTHDNSFLTQFVRWNIGQTDAPASFHVLGALMAIATCANTETWVGIGSQKFRPNLFGMIIGPSGRARKSWSLSKSSSLIEEVISGRVSSKIGSYEAAVDEIEQKRHSVILEPEFSRFLKQARDGGGAGGSHLSAIKAALCDMFDCADLTRRTRKTGTQVVRNYWVNFFAAISDAYLATSTDPDDWTGGFLSRWLFMRDDRTRYERVYDIPEDPTGRAELLERLNRIYLSSPAGTFVIKPSRMINEWVDGLELQGRETNERLQGLTERAPILTNRVACLIAIDRMVNVEGYERPGGMGGHTLIQDTKARWNVTEADIAPAIEIVKRSLENVAVITDQVQYTPQARLKAKILSIMPEDQVVDMGFITERTGELTFVIERYMKTLLGEKRIAAVQANDGLRYVKVGVMDVNTALRAEGVEPLPAGVQLNLPAKPTDVPEMFSFTRFAAPDQGQQGHGHENPAAYDAYDVPYRPLPED